MEARIRRARRRRAHPVDLCDVLGLRCAGPVLAPTIGLTPGVIAPERAAPLVLAAGAVVQRVRLGQRAAALLLGPGDVLTVRARSEAAPFRAESRALVPAVLACAGRADARDPALHVALVEAGYRRERAAAEQVVVAQLSDLESRLAGLLPALADRWGVVSPDGIVLPAFLRHWVLAELVGVRRPSLTTAVRRMQARGDLVRLPDGRWRLPARATATAPAAVALAG